MDTSIHVASKIIKGKKRITILEAQDKPAPIMFDKIYGKLSCFHFCKRFIKKANSKMVTPMEPKISPVEKCM